MSCGLSLCLVTSGYFPQHNASFRDFIVHCSTTFLILQYYLIYVSNQMRRQPKYVTGVKVIDVPSLFLSDSKSNLFTPKSLFKNSASTKSFKSQSKSLKKQLKLNSSSKLPTENYKKMTPTNSLKIGLSLKETNNNTFSKKQPSTTKQRKVVLIKNASAKNISTEHSKSVLDLKNKIINSTIKRRDSEAKQFAPSTSRSSTFRQQEEMTLFSNSSSVQGEMLLQKPSVGNCFFEGQQSLSQKFMKKRTDIYKVLQNLDYKFNKLRDIQNCSQKQGINSNNILSKMSQLSIETKDDVLSLIRNKILSPKDLAIEKQQNHRDDHFLFQSNKINKIYVNNYKIKNT